MTRLRKMDAAQITEAVTTTRACLAFSAPANADVQIQGIKRPRFARDAGKPVDIDQRSLRDAVDNLIISSEEVFT
jgi:hypothetical protein